MDIFAVAGFAAFPFFQQIWHVEFWGAAVGDLLLWESALPQNSLGGCCEACGEGLPGESHRQIVDWEFFNKTFQMEAPEGCPAQVYTIMKDVSFIYIFWFCIEIFPTEYYRYLSANLTSHQMLHRHGSWNQRRDQLLQPPETPWTSLGLRIPSDEGGKPSQEHPRSESECLSLCRVTIERWSKPVKRGGNPLLTR